MIQTDKNEP